MKHFRNALVVIVALSAVACTNKSMYQFGKNYQKNECIKEAKTAWQLEECDKLETVPFEDYQKQKKEVEQD
ncbi:hypothetical protein KO525_14305 [Psychrosphaera sp. B3R10]|uniref:hypothetical protein n=1 Tax=unclassified Psychrosphaera TaxID=2641570 RepID=UPI001C08111E|nr:MULTISPECIES: hypothetical protein [unclassified Psychrosphaera]MBU2883349.1 hypothetical protein [Psychrosphaera sp. I2R16]MBU2990557.1 hypothetical protein [Psychrosphaera sp. B3R10]MDO6718969.1 hypothetical protein [Psychrosphaera sp. 1_MG-2023]